MPQNGRFGKLRDLGLLRYAFRHNRDGRTNATVASGHDCRGRILHHQAETRCRQNILHEPQIRDAMQDVGSVKRYEFRRTLLRSLGRVLLERLATSVRSVTLAPVNTSICHDKAWRSSSMLHVRGGTLWLQCNNARGVQRPPMMGAFSRGTRWTSSAPNVPLILA